MPPIHINTNCPRSQNNSECSNYSFQQEDKDDWKPGVEDGWDGGDTASMDVVLAMGSRHYLLPSSGGGFTDDMGPISSQDFCTKL